GRKTLQSVILSDERERGPQQAPGLCLRWGVGARSRRTPMAASNPRFVAVRDGCTVILAAIGLLRLAALAQDDISRFMKSFRLHDDQLEAARHHGRPLS